MRALTAEIDAMSDQLVGWRRDFHRHPELAFEERRTASVVRAFLESRGVEVKACARTGLRGVLKGGRPGRTVALRADMDALPVTEETELEYRSQAPGTMHACGHDGHMAILMGTASLLAAHREELPGSVVFLFQPSEEHPPGGARPMIDEGALDGVDAVFGLHLWQPLPTGVVGLCPGAMMAASDVIRVVVRGRGGHASQPHLTIDPVVVASHVIIAAQSIASRFVDPLQPVVVSFTTVHGGRTHNIIPDEVALTGTVRTLDAGVQRSVKQRLRDVCEQTCALFGATCDFEYEEGYPALVNDLATVGLVGRVAEEEFGAGSVTTIAPVMGGEDFSYYLQRVPGAFVMLGIGDGRPYPHHNPRFDIDERALPAGVRLMTRTALELLAGQAGGRKTLNSSERKAVGGTKGPAEGRDTLNAAKGGLMKRRTFLRMSSLAGAAAAAGWPGGSVLSAQAAREYYELRVYEMPTGNRKTLLNDYLSKAAIPAWNRLGIGPVGVFTVVSGANALMLYVLIPHPDLATFESTAAKLASDAEYQKAAAPYLGASIDNPAYTRYEGWLLHAFKTIPRLRVPAETAEKAPRIFELRVYESHSEAAALKKIEMFNEGGEIALFDRIGLRPVFFGQTLAGPRQPNLVYMTVHHDMTAREKVWETFRNDEGWKKLSSDPAFANTVSATTVIFLRPAAYSQI